MTKENLIKGLKLKIRDCDSDPNDVSWGMQYGILISKSDAQAILEFLNEKTVSEANRKLCPECNQPYITYTSDEYYQCNSCDHTWI